MIRLSSFKNGEALEVLADIIEPASVIMSDREIVERARKATTRLDAIKIALKKYKTQVVEIVAALHRTTPEEVEFDMVTLIGDVLSILNDPVLVGFFDSQSQSQDTERYSGSATENTEEKEK